MDGLGRWLILCFFKIPQEGERRGFSCYVEIQQKENERGSKNQSAGVQWFKWEEKKRDETLTINRVLLHDFHNAHDPWGFAV